MITYPFTVLVCGLGLRLVVTRGPRGLSAPFCKATAYLYDSNKSIGFAAARSFACWVRYRSVSPLLRLFYPIVAGGNRSLVCSTRVFREAESGFLVNRGSTLRNAQQTRISLCSSHRHSNNNRNYKTRTKNFSIMASPDQRAPAPPAEEFNQDTVALHLGGLADQANLFQSQNQNQATLGRILATVEATNDRMGAMETRMGTMQTRMADMEKAITDRINTMETGINRRLDKLESFAKNTNARAKNARARELGIDYTQ
ncbi:hypothetical protein FVER53590_14000 [Fusarium verticillioides]|nr:hypothetical protein FVER53590_14000 [Fusarium verticillioides]